MPKLPVSSYLGLGGLREWRRGLGCDKELPSLLGRMDNRTRSYTAAST
jgi:hypothetical protein